jgi:MFS family permease
VGIAGIILIDLSTFLIAVVFLFFIHIPHPEQSEHGLAALGGFWMEALGALRYLTSRKPLWIFILFTAFINFMLNGPLDLTLPYLILLTNSEKVAGSVIGVTSLGAFAGAALIAAWGGTRPRMKTIVAGLLLTGAMFLFFGILRTPVSISVVLFILFMSLPMIGTMYVSILQVKSPPDLQGRIFALTDQLGFIGSTTSFALTGYLVDHVLNPSVGSQAWEMVQPLVGDGPGAGIGLVQVVTGIIILAATLMVFASARIRNLEAQLPDYEVVNVGTASAAPHD